MQQEHRGLHVFHIPGISTKAHHLAFSTVWAGRQVSQEAARTVEVVAIPGESA